MYLLIDTNIYLGFFEQNALDDPKSLDILLKEFQKKKNKIKLLLPRQIEDEFIRHINTVTYLEGFEGGIKQLRTNTKFKNSVPDFLKKVTGYEQVKRIEKSLNKKMSSLLSEYSRVHNKRYQSIYNKIQKLFSHSVRSVESDEVLNRAHQRTLRGNPPKKGVTSFGDAIIWEWVLDKFFDDDLFLVSKDPDFASKCKECELNELLQKEWAEKSENKKIKLYSGLGQFLNNELKSKMKISKKEIEEEKKVAKGLGDYINYTSAHSIPMLTSDVTCSCCGIKYKEVINFFSESLTSVTLYHKCPDCQGPFPTFCTRCGKHFHKDSISYFFNEDICPTCKLTGGFRFPS